MSFSRNSEIVWPLIWLSFLPPVVAAYVDATYHGWYRLLVLREAEIGRFINHDVYRLPRTQAFPAEGQSFDERILGFPVFDLDGIYTFGEKHKIRLWEKSNLRSLASFTPLLVYASQLCGSATVVLSLGNQYGHLRFIPIALVIITTLALFTAERIKRPIRE